MLVGALALAASVYGGSVIATPISSDPYMNPESQHRTQLEPDSFGYGNTVVATFQTGRFFNGGSSNIGWATTTNAGRTWTTGMLPGTTIYEGGPWARISDPAVAYDPLHDVWMISTLAIDANVSGAAVLTSRSTDGGLTWGQPVTTSTSSGTFYDKNWITCDTWPQSPHYGNCYQEWDDSTLYMSTSTDGGLTWGPKKTPGTSGIGGQPVVQPNGTVVVPYEGGAGIRAFRSTDGGNTWLSSVPVATVSSHGVAGNLRTSPLPSAEVAGDGKVYVAWQDCSFRSGCSSNDIVYSTSLDGVTWTAKARVPIDPTTSGVDHFIPGFAVDRSTSGNSTRLALGYYYYPVAACNSGTCQLTVGFTSSTDAGATWTAGAQGGRPDQPVLDRQHEPGRDGRRLHVDVVRRRAARVPDLRGGQGEDGNHVRRARLQRPLRRDRSVRPAEGSRSPRPGAVPQAHAADRGRAAAPGSLGDFPETG